VGGVATEGERIAQVGTGRDPRGRARARVVDLAGRALLAASTTAFGRGHRRCRRPDRADRKITRIDEIVTALRETATSPRARVFGTATTTRCSPSAAIHARRSRCRLDAPPGRDLHVSGHLAAVNSLGQLGGADTPDQVAASAAASGAPDGVPGERGRRPERAWRTLRSTCFASRRATRSHSPRDHTAQNGFATGAPYTGGRPGCACSRCGSYSGRAKPATRSWTVGTTPPRDDPWLRVGAVKPVVDGRPGLHGLPDAATSCRPATIRYCGYPRIPRDKLSAWVERRIARAQIAIHGNGDGDRRHPRRAKRSPWRRAPTRVP
jgi:hypothetical protein